MNTYTGSHHGKNVYQRQRLRLRNLNCLHARKIEITCFDIEEASWLNPIENCFSVHIKDSSCGLMFTNGKGSSAKSCLASALGEYFERLSCNDFFADFYLGQKISQDEFVHYPNEKWFFSEDDSIPQGIMDESLWHYFDPNNEITVDKLYDMNSGAGRNGTSMGTGFIQ